MATNGTYVNFSMPHRTQSLKSGKSSSLFSRRSSIAQSEDEEVLPYRPMKAKYVQVHHVTSDDIQVRQRRPSIDSRSRPPAIPERTTSLIGHRKTNTWPSSANEQRAAVYEFDQAPMLVKTPWELERGRPNSRWSRVSDRTQNLPKRIFVQLPREIYQCIVDHLEAVHAYGDNVDVPELRSDLKSLCLVDKKWLRVSRESLYRELWLPSNKAPAKRKWSTKQPRSRLRMLVDTLQKNQGLGFLIHHICVPNELANELDAEACSPFKKGSGLDALQLIISQSYNLEQVSGFVLPATSSTVPVLEALASRTRLKSHVWSLDSVRSTLPDLADFVFCHDGWSNMESLVLAADPGVDLGIGALSAVLHRLPSLKHLMVSGLHCADFTNTTLLTLPPVKSLRLENLGGLTDQGVEQLAYSRLAFSLERLTLVGLELVSLQTIQTLLSHLTRLKRFALVQETTPEPQLGVNTAGKAVMLCSPSLKDLHWDCMVPGSALSWLAEAIEEGKFPKLRIAKVPCDYEGQIQRLCRPVPLRKLSPADLEYLSMHTQNHYERNLQVSRIQAQVRVREFRQQPSFNVVVQDESNEVQSIHTIGSYIGNMSSRIEYCLEPSVGRNALAELEDIARPIGTASERHEQRVDVAMLF